MYLAARLDLKRQHHLNNMFYKPRLIESSVCYGCLLNSSASTKSHQSNRPRWVPFTHGDYMESPGISWADA